MLDGGTPDPREEYTAICTHRDVLSLVHIFRLINVYFWMSLGEIYVQCLTPEASRLYSHIVNASLLA